MIEWDEELDEYEGDPEDRWEEGWADENDWPNKEDYTEEKEETICDMDNTITIESREVL